MFSTERVEIAIKTGSSQPLQLTQVAGYVRPVATNNTQKHDAAAGRQEQEHGAADAYMWVSCR